MLQKSLVIIGATLGLVLGVIGTSVPWLCPNLFTPDENVIREVRFSCFFSYFIFTHFLQELFFFGVILVS